MMKALRELFKLFQDQTSFSPQVIQSAIDFYTNLYTTPHITPEDHRTALNFLNNNFQEHLTTDEIHDLLTPFTDEELHDAAQKLASKGPSSPGPDGWTYQTWYKSWPISGDFLANIANHIFQHPDAFKEPRLSSIIIRLLPKDKFDEQSPDVNHLRPISLMNTYMRIIMFAFTTRLIPCLSRIISSLQQAYLPNTSIHTNIQTANILAAFLESVPTSSSSLLLVDFSKAFDNVRHDYICTLLNQIGFPTSVIEFLLAPMALPDCFFWTNIRKPMNSFIELMSIVDKFELHSRKPLFR
ncbi:unnamed protein product [Ambrosiozyma monospora]|uniref:Unnamed protein product n=1 Tax=Ambrosiozyma monospora TaxID=43982 RepID=A0A9W6Z601_AMBMO|nr:unnamed protein product [Ambrosiozyma monospora]